MDVELNHHRDEERAKGLIKRLSVLIVLSVLVMSCGSGGIKRSSVKSSKPPKIGTSTTTTGTTASPSTPQSTVTQASPIWMITYSAATKYLPTTLAQGILNNPNNLVIYGPNQRPGRFASKSLTDFKSFDSISGETSTLSSENIYGAVVDLERWSYTPLIEQQNPALYYKMASSSLHALNLKLVATPGLDLFKGIGRGPLYSLMLKSGLYTSVAKVANIIDIQAQSLENDPTLYAAFVLQASNQIRSVNPSAIVLAGLTTSVKSGIAPTGQTLEQDAHRVEGVVGGFWINIPSNGPACPTCSPVNPQPAVALLQSYAS